MKSDRYGNLELVNFLNSEYKYYVEISTFHKNNVIMLYLFFKLLLLKLEEDREIAQNIAYPSIRSYKCRSCKSHNV